jgi:hypothetical protein
MSDKWEVAERLVEGYAPGTSPAELVEMGVDEVASGVQQMMDGDPAAEWPVDHFGDTMNARQIAEYLIEWAERQIETDNV